MLLVDKEQHFVCRIAFVVRVAQKKVFERARKGKGEWFHKFGAKHSNHERRREDDGVVEIVLKPEVEEGRGERCDGVVETLPEFEVDEGGGERGQGLVEVVAEREYREAGGEDWRERFFWLCQASKK